MHTLTLAPAPTAAPTAAATSTASSAAGRLRRTFPLARVLLRRRCLRLVLLAVHVRLLAVGVAALANGKLLLSIPQPKDHVSDQRPRAPAARRALSMLSQRHRAARLPTSLKAPRFARSVRQRRAPVSPEIQSIHTCQHRYAPSRRWLVLHLTRARSQEGAKTTRSTWPRSGQDWRGAYAAGGNSHLSYIAISAIL